MSGRSLARWLFCRDFKWKSYSSKGLCIAVASSSEDGRSTRCSRNGRPWMQFLSPRCRSILCSVSSTSSRGRFVGSWRASRTASPWRVKITIADVHRSRPSFKRWNRLLRKASQHPSSVVFGDSTFKKWRGKTACQTDFSLLSSLRP